MSCNNCGNQNCLCTGVNLTSIKGDVGPTGATGATGPQGPQGVPGPTGSPGVSALAYQAWADDSIGTGFTLIPSDKLYYATVDTIAGGSPVVGDFTGRWFRINQPEKEYKEPQYLNNVETLSIPGLGGGVPVVFTTPINTLTVPNAFFNNNRCIAEYEVEISFAHSGGDNSSVGVVVDVNGVNVRVFETEATISGTHFTTSKIKVYYASSTSYLIRLERYTYVNSGTLPQIYIEDYSAAVTAGDDVSFTVESYDYDGARGNLTIKAHNVKAYNDSKTTF